LVGQDDDTTVTLNDSRSIRFLLSRHYQYLRISRDPYPLPHLPPRLP
jgi:hypothetical protein